jgi:hypothetical protein
MEILKFILNLNPTLFLFIALLIVGVIIFGYWLLFLKPKKRPEWKDKLEKRYRDYQHKKLPSNYQIIELDKLLEYALKLRYRTDEGLGNVLKTRSKNWSKQTLNDLWFAHKIRNKLAHDPEYLASPSELNKAKIILDKQIRALIE